MRWKSILLAAVMFTAAGLGVGFYWSLGYSARFRRLPGVVEIQEVRLSSKVGGRVARVDVAEGDLVQAGQPLLIKPGLRRKSKGFHVGTHVQQAQAESLVKE